MSKASTGRDLVNARCDIMIARIVAIYVRGAEVDHYRENKMTIGIGEIMHLNQSDIHHGGGMKFFLISRRTTTTPPHDTIRQGPSYHAVQRHRYGFREDKAVRFRPGSR